MRFPCTESPSKRANRGLSVWTFAEKPAHPGDDFRQAIFGRQTRREKSFGDSGRPSECGICENHLAGYRRRREQARSSEPLAGAESVIRVGADKEFTLFQRGRRVRRGKGAIFLTKNALALEMGQRSLHLT